MHSAKTVLTESVRVLEQEFVAEAFAGSRELNHDVLFIVSWEWQITEGREGETWHSGKTASVSRARNRRALLELVGRQTGSSTRTQLRVRASE
jgi:hypothetical protein